MIHHVAICQTCEWIVDARNAHGVGAQHATRYGHQVEVQIGYVYRGMGVTMPNTKAADARVRK